jgi:rhodanese-related sulfurtransferase
MKRVRQILPVIAIVGTIAVAGLWARSSQADSRYVVSADHIRLMQADATESDRFVIIDVRDERESSVSILPGAITLDEFEGSEQHRGKTAIVYCTVGVRSHAYASRLREQGWEAYNYKGGILDWCRQGLPLTTRDGQPTDRVHTYSSWYSVPAGYLAIAN